MRAAAAIIRIRITLDFGRILRAPERDSRRLGLAVMWILIGANDWRTFCGRRKQGHDKPGTGSLAHG